MQVAFKKRVVTKRNQMYWTEDKRKCNQLFIESSAIIVSVSLQPHAVR